MSQAKKARANAIEAFQTAITRRHPALEDLAVTINNGPEREEDTQESIREVLELMAHSRRESANQMLATILERASDGMKAEYNIVLEEGPGALEILMIAMADDGSLNPLEYNEQWVRAQNKELIAPWIAALAEYERANEMRHKGEVNGDALAELRAQVNELSDQVAALTKTLKLVDTKMSFIVEMRGWFEDLIIKTRAMAEAMAAPSRGRRAATDD